MPHASACLRPLSRCADVSIIALGPPACRSECELALDVFRQLRAEGLAPNLVRFLWLFRSSLHACTHACGLPFGTSCTLEEFLFVHACCGWQQVALEIQEPCARQHACLCPMSRHPVCAPTLQVTYNILIDIHGKAGQWAKAVEVLSALAAQVRGAGSRQRRKE